MRFHKPPALSFVPEALEPPNGWQNIIDESGLRIAEVHKTVYIRRKKPHASRIK